MENPEIPKFSSCRGVSFEINNLFKLPTPANEPRYHMGMASQCSIYPPPLPTPSSPLPPAPPHPSPSALPLLPLPCPLHSPHLPCPSSPISPPPSFLLRLPPGPPPLSLLPSGPPTLSLLPLPLRPSLSLPSSLHPSSPVPTPPPPSPRLSPCPLLPPPLPLLPEEEENVANQEATVTKSRTAKETRLSVLLLDQGLFTVYKLLFAASLSLNIVGLVLAITGHFNYAKQNAALFSISNILALTLCRSEAFLRLVFWLAVKVLGRIWVPLSIKTSTTSFLQCIGGVHSSCGVSSLLWLIYSLFLALQKRQNTSPQIIAVASIILALLSLASLAAFPLVRHLHHNVFERAHRFAGWTSLALLWLFLFLTHTYNSNSKSYHFHSSTLVKKQELWFTAAITILIFLPWVTVKRVPVVTVTAPSRHTILIKFSGGVRPGILGRISRSPLSEWHAFGIISNGRNEHIMLVGAVGDFTKGLVSKPPNHLWIRGVKFAGLPYLVNMYERVVLVATGSGICVFLSFLVQPVRADVYLVWVAKGVEHNFGEEIVGMVNGYGKEKVMVHDTGVLGRPNIGELSVKAARDWGAQVVVVTSNLEGTKDVVNACKARGIAAFGPIWDS